MQDYNNKLAQLRAGKSSKSKLLLAKFKSSDSLEGWEVRQGTYFQDVVAAKYDGGMDAKFEFTETRNCVFSGKLHVQFAAINIKGFLHGDIGNSIFQAITYPVLERPQ